MLTRQKALYAQARHEGKAKRESAIAAGCPPRTASQAASRYERDHDVIECMRRLKAGAPMQLMAVHPTPRQPPKDAPAPAPAPRTKPPKPAKVAAVAPEVPVVELVTSAPESSEAPPWVESSKPAEPPPSHGQEGDPLPQTDDPIVWLRAAMNCPEVPINERAGAAKKLADLEAKKAPEAPKKVNKFRKPSLKVVGA